jgi:hypothetical protein
MRTKIFFLSVYLAVNWALGFSQTTLASSPIRNNSDRYNFWSISSYKDHANGSFLFCEATQNYANGHTLAFVIYSDYRWGIRVDHPAWNIAPGNEILIRYKVDQGNIISLNGRSISRNSVAFFLPSDNNLFQNMRRGAMLFVEIGGYTTSFRLTDSSVILERLSLCVQSGGANLRLQPRQPTPMPQPQPYNRQPPSQINPLLQVTSEQRLGAALFVSRLLAQTGMERMRLLGPSELAGVGKTPFEAGGTDIVWESFDGTVMGFLTVIRIVRDLEFMVSEMFSVEARGCQGQFVSGRLSDVEFPQARRILSYCSENENSSLFSGHIFFAISGDTAYHIMVVGNGSQQIMNREEQRVWTAVRSAMRQ